MKAGLSIRAVVFLGFGLILGLWIFAWVQLSGRISAAQERTSGINARYMSAQETLSNIRAQVLLASVVFRDALLDRNPDRIGRYRDQLEQSYSALDELLAGYVPATDLPVEGDQFGKLRDEVTGYRDAMPDALKLTIQDNGFGFDPAGLRPAERPSTYPNRLTIRAPGPLDYSLTTHVGEAYAQDKWQVKPGLTLSLGVRYDLEVMPIRQESNPLYADASQYPVDTNNIAPRIGFVWNPDGQSKSVIRGGYGMFYDRTLLDTVDNLLTETKFVRSFTGNFPLLAVDPGPAAGRFPTDPTLTSGPSPRSHRRSGPISTRCTPRAAWRGTPPRSRGPIPSTSSSRISIRSAPGTSASSCRAGPGAQSECVRDPG